MTNERGPSRRRLDVPSLLLLSSGVVFGLLSYWLVVEHDVNSLVIVPSIVVATVGATHITKLEAPHG